MTDHTYRHSDLEPLTGAIRAIESIGGMPHIEIRHAGEAFTLLASAEDVPPPLLSMTKISSASTMEVER